MPSDTDVILRSLCEKCKKPVNNGPKCNKCSATFHLSCAKLLKKVKVINESDVVCCDNDGDEPDNIAVTPSPTVTPEPNMTAHLTNEIKYLKEIITHKDIIIKELYDKIGLLTENISLIKTLSSVKPEPARNGLDNRKNDGAKEMSTKTHKENQTDKVTDIQIIKTASGDQLTNENNLNKHNDTTKRNYASIVNTTMAAESPKIDNRAKLEIDQKNMMDKITNINGDLLNTLSTKTPTNDDFTLVQKKKRIFSIPKNTIIGQSNKQGMLRAPAKRAWIYVGGCDRETTTTTIIEYIKDECPDIGVIECVELKTVGQLKAFQVGLKFEYLNKIMNEEFWPAGIKIRRFNFRFFQKRADTHAQNL